MCRWCRGTGWRSVVPGGDIATGQDPETGKEWWRIGGFNPTDCEMNRTIVSAAVVSGQVVVEANRGRPYISFRAGGVGDVTGKREVRTNNLGPGAPTSASDGMYLYVLRENGTMNCPELKTGKVMPENQRIEPGTNSPSPLVADGKIFRIDAEGTVTVTKGAGV